MTLITLTIEHDGTASVRQFHDRKHYVQDIGDRFEKSGCDGVLFDITCPDEVIGNLGLFPDSDPEDFEEAGAIWFHAMGEELGFDVALYRADFLTGTDTYTIDKITEFDAARAWETTENRKHIVFETPRALRKGVQALLQDATPNAKAADDLLTAAAGSGWMD